MKLAQAARSIEDGDVLLVEGRSSLFSWLIKLGTLSRFTHAGVAVWIRLGARERLCIFESMEGYGVRLCPLDRYLEERTARGERVHWYRLDERRVDRRRVCAFLLQTWGLRYASTWQLLVSFGRLTRWLRGLLGLGPRDLDPHRFFCSELVADALGHGGWRPDACCPDLPAATSPEQVALFTVLRHKGVLE